MAPLGQEIKEYLKNVPDPDQTFRQYVEELIAAPNAFGGPFAGNQQQTQTQPTPQTSITEGMFNKYLNEGGGDGGSGSVGSAGSSGSAMGQGISPTAQAIGFGLMANPQAVGQIASLFGVPSVVGSLAASALGKGIIGNQIDAISNSFGALGGIGLGGVGTISDAAGNVMSITNPGMVDAYDLATFGTTGGGLSSGFGFGGVSASDMGNLGFGGGSLGGFATDGGGAGGGSGGSSGGGEGPGGSPNAGGLGGFGGW